MSMSLEWPRYSEGFDDFVPGAATGLPGGSSYLQEGESAAPKTVVEHVAWLLPRGLRAPVKGIEVEEEEETERNSVDVSVDVGDNRVVRILTRPPSKKAGRSSTKARRPSTESASVGKRKVGCSKSLGMKKRRRENTDAYSADEDKEEGGDDRQKFVASTISRERLSRACKKVSTERGYHENDSDSGDGNSEDEDDSDF